MFLSKDITYCIISLGCSKNLVDSEKINGALSASSFQFEEEPELADIIIINTCGFIEDAKKESIDLILDTLEVKKKYNGNNNRKLFVDRSGNRFVPFIKRIVVCGCLSQRYFKEIRKEIPEIDLLYGIPDDNFVQIVAQKFHIRLTQSGKIRSRHLDDNPPYSYIKISEGCSNNCSYCAIPLIRGPHISRSIDSIVEDSKHAVETGSIELIFVAQDTASYSYEGKRLPELIHRVSEIDGIRWIRILYSHPDNITEEIIELFRDNERVVKYIDIPFQHVSKKILHSMGRKGSYKKYENMVRKLRTKIPQIRIRSTFMVGYPGESDEDFDELIEFIKSVRLDRIGCFTYSQEDQTRASLLNDDVPANIKKLRYQSLMETQRIISEEILSKLVGKEIDVLVEGRLDNETYTGRSEYDAPEVDGFFYLTADAIPINSIVRAQVIDSTEYDLVGVLS